MADMTSIMLVGVSTNGDTSVATDGLTNSPTWVKVIGGFNQVAGSSGNLIGVGNNAASYGILMDGTAGKYNWTLLTGDVVQVSFDYPTVAAINTSGGISYIDNIAENTVFKEVGGKYKWVSVKGKAAFAIGTDNGIYYTSNVGAPSWANVATTLAGKTFTQVAFDGVDVAVLDSTNTVYYADTNLPTSPNWRELKGASLQQISLSNRMIYGVGSDSKMRFSLSQTPSPAWTILSSSTQMSSLVCMSSTNGTMVVNRIPDTTPCQPGYTRSGGGCYPACPSGYDGDGGVCKGIPIPRASRPSEKTPPVLQVCPSGYEVYLKPTAKCNRAVDGRVSEYVPPEEVYRVSGSFAEKDALNKCESYGGTLASSEQMVSAQAAGAAWCEWGWNSEKGTVSFPTQADLKCNVGDSSPVNKMQDAKDTHAINCYGVKPPESQFPDILAFNATKWNQAEQCPFGHFLATDPDMCHSVCPSGTIPKIGACSFPDGVTENIIRTFKPAFQKNGNLNPCNPDEELVGYNCLKRCSDNQTSDDVNCTPQPIPRTAYPEGQAQTCGPNETLQDGVCVSKCPPGSVLNGLQCVTEGFQASSCTETAYGIYKKFLCDTSSLASSKLKEKLNPQDQVCIADDPTTGMYFCQSVKDAKLNTGFLNKVRSNYSSSCDKFMKYYLDMSNNLTNLVNAQSGMTHGTGQLTAALASLDSIYNGLQCVDSKVNVCLNSPSDPSCADPFTAMCKNVKDTRNAVRVNNSDINAKLGTIIPNISNILSQRDDIMKLQAKYKCDTSVYYRGVGLNT